MAPNITYVQLKLAILERAWPPTMLFRMAKPMPLITVSKLGTMAP
jgi:hypothetical protein